MFYDEYSAMTIAARTKVTLLENNPFGYLMASILAGLYIGFGILLIFTIGGLLGSTAYTKIVMGLSFGIALSLVIIAGSELFTGNNLVMAGGIFSKTIRMKEACKLWIVCYLGNWIGSILLAVMFYLAGLATGTVGEFIASSSATKMSLPFTALFFRGMLCNILVSLAVWCGFRCKSDSGKLIMVFWCLFAFITCGFEHCVANMTLLTVSLIAPMGEQISIIGYLYNLAAVTLGNMAGGILCVALPYFIITKKKEV